MTPLYRPRYFRAWWRGSRVEMRQEDWIYIAVLLVGSLWAFGLGLLIGWIWLLTL